jgi:imidazolonepropionase-like amidohydrolase
MDPLFVSHGVTTVRDVGNNVDDILAHRERSATLGAKRPRIYACGPLLDGPTPRWGGRISRSITTVDEARAAARDLIQRKVDCLKLYEQLTPALVQGVVEEATPHGVMVTAHLRDTRATDAVALGVRGLEHASGIDYRSVSADGLRGLAALFASKGVFVVPTLVVLERVLSRLQSPQLRNDPLLGQVPMRRRELWETPFETGRWTDSHVAPTLALLRQRIELVQHLTRATGRVVAGSDTPNPYIIPGASLHRELELLVEAGLTPLQAIGAATRAAAEFLGQEVRLGTLTPGKIADLVILGGDPLADISNVRQVEAVLRDGVVVWKK